MEKGGWSPLLVIDTEDFYEIKLAKKDGNLLMNFRASLFHLTASKLYTSKILIPDCG